MSRHIDYYFSLVSPWAYIGHKFFLDIARRHDARIVYKPVLLTEVFSHTGGLPLAKRHPARQAYRTMDLQRWREKRKLLFHLWPKHWPYDSDLANRVVLAIVAAGGEPAQFVQRVFSGVWENEEDYGEAAILACAVQDAGFDAKTLIARAESADIRDIYEQNRRQAIHVGVFGSPSYVLNGEIFWGQDRLDLLDDALASGRAPFTAAT